jgi:hypothetical protein
MRKQNTAVPVKQTVTDCVWVLSKLTRALYDKDYKGIEFVVTIG